MNRKKIAVLIASIDREYQSDFVQGVFAAAEERDVDVCVFNCQGHMNVDVSTSDLGESAIFDLTRMRDFDGVISLRETFADEVTLRKVEETLQTLRDLPHVSIDRPTPGAVSITFDDAVSVRQLTNHLIEEHGAKDIVYLSGPLKQIVALTRLQACREAMEAHGLHLSPENIFEGEWINGSGRRCVRELLQRGEGLPDAIICGNDDMALGAAEYLHEQGYLVPDDVMVTGFDALREAVSRGMTTIRRPIDQAAREAVSVLDGWMNGQPPEEWQIILPTITVCSDSCGCRTPDSPSQARMHTVRTGRRQTENTLLQVSMFNGSLASVADEQDAHEKIDQFVSTLGIRELYLCVDPALTRDMPRKRREYAYPDQMLMLYGRSGEVSHPIGVFDTCLLVPHMEEERKEPLRLIFCPLYYRERNFGYLAMGLNHAVGVALYSVLMLFTGALTSLYLQNSLRSYARKLEELSIHDIMTGMLNRRGFMEKAPEVMGQARAERKYFVMLSADMDYMKKVNDQYGHQMGDQAICRMGRAMKKLEARGIVPVHISGDEFLAYGLAETLPEAQEALRLAHAAIRRINEEEPWIVETSASIGMYAAVPREGETLDLFLTRADHAMYEEKRRKKQARNQ